MITKETQEQISALADGELDHKQIEQAMLALRAGEARADWEVYHQIGDVLRSDDMDMKLSKDFMARFSERLEAEPAIVAPIAANSARAPTNSAEAPGLLRRFGMPGMAAAAVIAAAFVTTPHLLVAEKDKGSDAGTPIITVADSKTKSGVVSASASASMQGKANAVEYPEGVVLRDPRIDEYLMAHQRFSPSVFGSAQYARSATFASEAGK